MAEWALTSVCPRGQDVNTNESKSVLKSCLFATASFERGGTYKSGISKDQVVELQRKIGGLLTTAKPGLAIAVVVHNELSCCFDIIFDTAGAIGDEISIDFKSYGVTCINVELEQHYKQYGSLIVVPSQSLVTKREVILTPDCSGKKGMKLATVKPLLSRNSPQRHNPNPNPNLKSGVDIWCRFQ
jgi:hypothetical protein